MALRSRLGRLERRLAPSIAAPDPAVTDRLRERIASAVEAVEGVLGAPDDVRACSLMERVARLHRLTDGVAFPWWPAMNAARRGRRLR
jgi:hypothetical protein